MGELGAPGATGVEKTGALSWYKVSVRAERLTTMWSATKEMLTSALGIHAVDSLGRTGT